MEIRHVIADQDYFMLVEIKLQPNMKQFVEKEGLEEKGEWVGVERDSRLAKNILLKIHRKVHLRNVESLVDRSEPRNLIVGFVTEKDAAKVEQDKDISEEMLLYFDNANKCTYVKNMLDMKKQSQRKRVVQTVKNYLEDCVVGNVLAAKHEL